MNIQDIGIGYLTRQQRNIVFILGHFCVKNEGLSIKEYLGGLKRSMTLNHFKILWLKLS